VPFLDITEPHLRAILDAIPDGIGVERDGVIVWANHAFSTIYGYPDPEAVCGRTLGEFVARGDRERLLQYTERRRQGLSVPDHYMFQAVRRDGTRVDLEIFTASYAVADAVYVVGAVRDVTQRLEIARRMEQSQKLEALGTLSRGIAHEFNNLLATVLGNVTLLQDIAGSDPRPEAFTRCLDRIRSAAERGSTLSRQLQAFSGPAPDEGSADPAAVLNDARALLQPSLPPRTQVHLDLEPDLPLVSLPASTLQQILLHLGLNALDAMPGGGHLTIRCGLFEPADETRPPDRPPGRYLRFQVQDTGTGIGPEALPRVFEPFFTTKPPEKGSGLGLAVVFGVARANGGWVEVESRLGEGSVFSVWLPPGEPPPPPTGRHPAPARAREGETLLVVEDEEDLRALYRDVLVMNGYRVLEADGPEEALDRARVLVEAGQHLHLVVMDLLMPRMDGAECARRLQEVQPGLAVLLCTGLERDERVVSLPREILAGVLKKPISVRTLLTAVRQALDR
jgi:two-component system, cell cycle sensor histidine kinase and response regulator CckA